MGQTVHTVIRKPHRKQHQLATPGLKRRVVKEAGPLVIRAMNHTNNGCRGMTAAEHKALDAWLRPRIEGLIDRFMEGTL
jgi:hypothetical protein